MKGLSCSTWCVLLVLLLAASPYDVTSSLISGADLGVRLKRTAEEALGSKQIQALYDREAKFMIDIPEGNKTVDHVAKWLSLYIGELYEVVDNNHDAILQSLSPPQGTESQEKPIIQCCDVDASKLPYVTHLGVYGDNKELCVRFATESADNPTTMRTDLLSSMLKNSLRLPNIGWQYYGAETGVHYSYMSRKTCKPYDPRKRPWYNKARASTPKDVVMVIDMTQNGDVNLKVKAAQTLLNATSPNDRVAVVAFCRQPFVPDGGTKGNACISSSLALATGPNIQSFLNFLSTISSECTGDSANYQGAIRRGFEYFQVLSGSDPDRKKVVVLLTDSNPSDAQTPQQIREAVKQENVNIDNQVVIMAYSFGTNISTSTQQLLRALAEDTNYTTPDGQQHRGRYTNIRSDRNLRYKMHAYFGLFADTKNSSRPIITAPYVDSSGLGLVVSICKSVFYQSNLTGVTCVDVRVEDIFLNSTYYQQGLGAYFFIINSEGRTISHPLLPKPSAILHNPVFVDINNLERDHEAKTVIESMKRGGSGYKTFYVRQRLDKGSFSGGHRQVASHYYWRQVENTDFSICLVFTDEDGQLDMSIKNQRHINYVHPFALRGYPTSETCINQGKIATTGASTVRFNGTALKSLPFSKPEKNIATRNANYFTRLAADQGRHFKENIMDDVEITGRIEPIWQRTPSSTYSYFLKWRYFATLSGIIRVYPGSYFHSFNPNVQPWFQNAAIANRGQVVLTRIKKEHKYGIMLSTAILMGSPKGRHSDLDLPVAVVAGEFPNAFFYNMLLSIFDACTKDDAVCFLVDDKGYVLVHTTYKDPQGPQCHLISMEPEIAHHLQERGDLEKRRCLDWEKYRVIHSWLLSPSDWVVKSTMPNYELHRVTGTNIFVGITKRTETQVEATCKCANFTQCSYKSDCPCYETLTFDYCNNKFSEVPDSEMDDSPTCPIENDVYSPFAKLPQDNPKAAPTEPCFSHSCADIETESECLPRSVCGWCPGEEQDSLRKCHDINSCPKYSDHNSIPIINKKQSFFGLLLGVSALSICILLGLVICLVRYHRIIKQLRKVPPPIPLVGALSPGESIYLHIDDSVAPQNGGIPLEDAPPLPITPTSNNSRPSSPRTPNRPSSPRTPNRPSSPQTPNRPSSPQTPNQPSSPRTPNRPSSPQTPNRPSSPQTPNQPSSPRTPNRPSSPQTPNRPSSPRTPNRPSSPQAPNRPSSPQTANALHRDNPFFQQTVTNNRPSSPQTPNGPQTEFPFFHQKPNGTAIMDQHFPQVSDTDTSGTTRQASKPPRMPNEEGNGNPSYVNMGAIPTQSQASLDRLDLELPKMERRKPNMGSDDTLVKQVYSGSTSDSGFVSRNNGNKKEDPSRYVHQQRKF